MATRTQPHSKQVKALLVAIAREEKAMLKLGVAVMSARAKDDDGIEGAPFFPLDLLALGAIKRSVATSGAMRQMVRVRNMVCARTLLRTHLDTALRFSAAWYVDQPHKFSTDVIAGGRIDLMKDSHGRFLKDSHLIQLHKDEHPWLERVYRNLSGYVHFSSSHFYDAVQSVDDETGAIRFLVGPRDDKYPDFSWSEILECFRQGSAMLAKFLHGYRLTKGLSRSELEALRGRPGAS